LCLRSRRYTFEQLSSHTTTTVQMDLSSEEVVDRMARAVELTIPPDARLGVRLAHDRLAKAAAEIMAFPVSADFEITPVIIP
jgi:hypothetical protein